jgi:DNA-binding transcriptional regulator PaaX
MNFNQLKIRVLDLFGQSPELHSEEVRKLLRQSKVDLTTKAMEMALLRYTRQGLLARTRKAGRFHYRLTEKGLARREWLSSAR